MHTSLRTHFNTFVANFFVAASCRKTSYGADMKISTGNVPVYTISGSEARPLPEWLIRKRKRSLKNDPEFANRVDLLQDFEFEEASQCVRVSEDGDWVMSTGTYTNTLLRSFRATHVMH